MCTHVGAVGPSVSGATPPRLPPRGLSAATQHCRPGAAQVGIAVGISDPHHPAAQRAKCCAQTTCCTASYFLLAAGLGITLGFSEMESVIVLDKPHLVSSPAGACCRCSAQQPAACHTASCVCQTVASVQLLLSTPSRLPRCSTVTSPQLALTGRFSPAAGLSPLQQPPPIRRAHG